MFKAHGATYQTIEEAQARWNELEADNLKIGYSDGRVTEQNNILEAIASEKQTIIRVAPQPVNENPFYVLTRKYLANGDCRTGRRTFKTRAAQVRYITNAPFSVAITAYN